MFDVFYSGVKPNLFAHERAADTIAHAQHLSRTRLFWWVNYLTDYTGFDFLFEPVPWQSEYTHTWPSTWPGYDAISLIPKSGDVSRRHEHADACPVRHHPELFHTLMPCQFDFTWVPRPWDPPYIYVFGNQWWPANKMPTVEYHVPGAAERKYMLYPRARLLANHNSECWTIPQDIDAETFDYSWVPDPGDPALIYQFGTQWQKTGGPKYSIPGATEIKYIMEPRANKIVQDANWHVPDRVDVSSFDFSWHPDATEQPYIYQFGTQHQRTGGPQYHVAGATETKYIDQIRIRTERVATAIYEIDHMDGAAGQIADVFRTVRYFDNYLDTLTRIAKNAPDDQEFVWICSSICDYTEFDFTWHPEVWQAGMLHVFPSDGERFGDTFFMHVPTFRYRADKLQLLDWYDINYMDKNVPRRPVPVVRHNYDTHVEAVKTVDWAGPLAVFATQDVTGLEIPAVPLWREKTKTIVPLSSGGSVCIVPKVAVPAVKTQLYDYAHINRTQQHMCSDEPLDIVFIDNGEPNAEDNWKILLQTEAQKHNLIHRSSGVTGRVAAYHAAAELSTTPWFFAVFAKLRVRMDFDWSWQPDRMQEPKHYIFHAFNPINGLTYGHQAMIAYNKRLVLNNSGAGLDFTLDSAHEVVPVLSGTAEYAYTPWMAWRTAFRECLKLKASADVESQYRLRKWLTVAMGQPYGEWSKHGAQDAVEYYDSVGGDLEQLRKSYDWAWLASYALIKRNLVAD